MEKSCQVIEILFWIGIGIVFYTYLGYGIVLYLMVKIKELFVKPRLPRLPETLPEATLLIAAYNEEAIVASKMVNCRQLDYPADKLRLVWITDGSNDNTNERLKEYPEVTVLYQPRRQGKTAALNRALPYVNTPYVIFTDANTMLNKGAIKEIIRQFSDPRVGCVAGEKRVEIQAEQGATAGEGIYWKYESALKQLDSRLYSAVGAAGELFAIRRELYEEMPADTLLDDFILSLRIVMRGYTIAYCADAYAVENGSRRRKTQSAYRCWRLTVRLASACIAQSAALRCVLFSIHIPPRTEMVAYARTVVPAVPPQYDSHFYVKHPSALCRHLVAASTVLLHGKLGALPVSKPYQE